MKRNSKNLKAIIFLRINIFLLISFSVNLYSQNTSLWSWGDNTFGQLGDGSTDTKFRPTQVGDETIWKSVVGGNYHSIGIKTDGTLWAWGDNEYGQLGDGTFIDKSTPTRIGTESDWKEIYCGPNYNIAIKENGTLWAWGLNDYGQLGLNDIVNRNSPTQVGRDNNWSKVTCGAGHTLAIKSNGTLWAWGDNDFGQIGDGTYLIQLVPIQIGSDNNWIEISSGIFHSLAIKTNGTLWAWGDNDYWQLGIPDNDIFYSTPTLVNAENNWKSIHAGGYHNLALKTDGTLWCWGDNEYGQLGDNSTLESHFPIQIENNVQWDYIGASTWNSFGIKADGTLWCWGDNEYGQLGEVSVEWFVTSPIQIDESNNWLRVSIGEYHVLGIKNQEIEPLRFSISGSIKENDNGIENIEVSNGIISVFTTANGFYIFENLVEADYTIAPISEVFNFTPENRNVTLNSILENIDFEAIRIVNRYNISGRITDSGNPMFNIEVNNGISSVFTNSDGIYQFENLEEGDYTIRPVSDVLNFQPDFVEVTLNENKSNINFMTVKSEIRYTISGRITKDDEGLAGVQVTNDLSTVITNQNGEYIFEDLAENEYRITPISETYNFFPELIIVQLDNNVNDANFTATLKIGDVRRKSSIDELSIYPQPNQGKFNVMLNTEIGDELRIYDLSGLVVYQKSFNLTQFNYELNIELNDVSNGVYFIELIKKDSIINQNLIINK
jgi:alpha-tubulin suppressor-like RCC1 family protein